MRTEIVEAFSSTDLLLSSENFTTRNVLITNRPAYYDVSQRRLARILRTNRIVVHLHMNEIRHEGVYVVANSGGPNV